MPGQYGQPGMGQPMGQPVQQVQTSGGHGVGGAIVAGAVLGNMMHGPGRRR